MSISLPLRDEFPFLQQTHATGKPWVYLDSAATTLKPRSVIDAVTAALAHHSTNVHRSVYELGDVTTELYEAARRKMASFLGASVHEIVFVRNATEGINLVAHGLPRQGITIVSVSEHHSNLLPWRRSSYRHMEPLLDESRYLETLENELTKGDVSLVAVSHVSNVTGLQIDIKRVATLVHRYGAVLLVDAAQSAGRVPIDVNDIDCDFLVCSGHKMYGPTGVGILYAKSERLHQLNNLYLGGGTVESVLSNQHELRQIPWRFEAGTPAIESAIGLGAAVDFLMDIEMDVVEKYEHELAQHAVNRLRNLKGIGFVSDDRVKTPTGVISFYVNGESSHVLARTLSDRYGICLRSGHHCAQPLHDALKIPPTMRISIGLYNNIAEIDRCIDALQEIVKNSTHVY